MSVIWRKFLLKLALRTQTFLKRGHSSALSIWTEKIKAKSEEEPRKQQLTVTLSDYKHLADTKQFFGKYKNLHVTAPFLPCFILYFRALSKYKPPGAYIRRGDLTEGFLRYEFEGLIFGGAYTWRGLFSEFYGNQYFFCTCIPIQRLLVPANSITVLVLLLKICSNESYISLKGKLKKRPVK